MQTRQFTSSVVFLAASIVLAAVPARAEDDRKVSAEREQQLLAILRSDAPAAEKAICCKRLAIHGSRAAVADLAQLLPNEQLSSWARIALEAISGPAADEALRKATDSLQGKLLVGTINSIGVRRDAGAVDLLTTRLRDSDAEVAAAAAVALGRIGNPAATKSLRAELDVAPVGVRSAVAEGCVLCAERLLAANMSAAAAAIYDEVRAAEVPKQRIIEATRGAILARGPEGIPLLLEQFRSPDKRFFQLGLSTAREFPGGDVDHALAAELARATPRRAALMIQAMADRQETVVLSALLTAAGQGPKQVRLAAIRALGRVGDASCLAALIEITLQADADLAQFAKETLAILPDEGVDEKIVALLPEAKGGSYLMLLQLVGQRRIDAVPDVLKALDNPDQDVRSAALVALGETVDLNGLSVLVSQVVSPKHPDNAQVAQQALKAACVRMPDREACAAELTMALERSPAATKGTLVEILADVGGTKALQALGAASKSDDTHLQDTGSRLLGKWNGVDAAPVLLDLARTAPAEKYQIRALRGYIGLARKFAMPPRRRAEMCQNALDAARRPAERKLVLEVLKLHPSTETLKLAVKAIRDPELKEEATQATQAIAKKLGIKQDDLRDLLSDQAARVDGGQRREPAERQDGQDNGLVSLYNGRDLAGWKTTGNWVPEADGVLAIKPRKGEKGWQRYDSYLWTDRTYGDYVLDLEFKIPKHGNSGVFVRVEDPANPVDTGIEVQILDSYGKKGALGHHDNGGVIRTVGPSKNMSKPAGEWNRMIVTCQGPYLQVTLNDEQIIDIELPKTAVRDRPAVGYIGLQDHGLPLWFRNIRLKPLK